MININGHLPDVSPVIGVGGGKGGSEERKEGKGEEGRRVVWFGEKRDLG